MNLTRYAALICAATLALGGVLWGLAAVSSSSHTPCAAVVSSPWLDTVDGRVYVCTTTGPVAVGANDAQPVWKG